MVMDGRTQPGIMSGADPYADPRLAAVYRALAESPDTAYRASVLPFRRTTAGTTEFAVPGFLMDAARGAVDLLAGPHTGQMSPEATAALASLGGSSVASAPTPGMLAALNPKMLAAAENAGRKVVYHYTRSDRPFDKFVVNTVPPRQTSFLDGIGVHAGSTEQAAAERFAKYWKGVPEENITGHTLPLAPKMERPLLRKDGNPYGEGELRSFLKSYAKRNGIDMDRREGQVALKKLLWEKYDSIPYVNSKEDRGAVSYILPQDNTDNLFDLFRAQLEVER